MVDVIQKRNGQFVKLVLSSRKENRNFFLIQDERGERTLDENQVQGEVVTIDLSSINEYPMHPKVLENIKNEMDQRGRRHKSSFKLTDLLRQKKIPFVDQRFKGGCLWIPHLEQIKLAISYLKAKGYYFKYHSTSKALGNNAGWFLSDKNA